MVLLSMTAYFVVGFVVAIALLAFVPTIISMIGFTSSGIAAGSIAALMMSYFGGAATAAGGFIAMLQSFGALGKCFSKLVFAIVGAFGALIGAFWYFDM